MQSTDGIDVSNEDMATKASEHRHLSPRAQRPHMRKARAFSCDLMQRIRVHVAMTERLHCHGRLHGPRQSLMCTCYKKSKPPHCCWSVCRRPAGAPDSLGTLLLPLTLRRGAQQLLVLLSPVPLRRGGCGGGCGGWRQGCHARGRGPVLLNELPVCLLRRSTRLGSLLCLPLLLLDLGKGRDFKLIEKVFAKMGKCVLHGGAAMQELEGPVRRTADCRHSAVSAIRDEPHQQERADQGTTSETVTTSSSSS